MQKQHYMNLLPIISSYINIISPYIYCILQTTNVSWWYLLNHTYLQEGLLIIKFHLIYTNHTFWNKPQKRKIVSASIYTAPSQKNKYFIWYLTNLLEFYWTRHEKVIIFDDFNKDTKDKVMKDFLQEHTF